MNPRESSQAAARVLRAAAFAMLLATGCKSTPPPPPPDLPAVGGQITLLRFPHGGGPVQAYRPDSLVESGWSSSKVPAIQRVFGVNLDERLIWAMDAQGGLVGVDLESHLPRKGPAGIRVGAVGPDGVLYLADGSRRILRLARRDEIAFHDSLPDEPRALYPALNNQVIAILAKPPRLIAASADQQVYAAAIPDGEAAATSWGDLVAIASDSGVALIETAGQRAERFIKIEHADRLGFSPSGHRVFVTQKDRPRIRVFDRFTLNELAPLQLPDTPGPFRLDSSGRWILVYRQAGDSLWVMDLTTGRLAASVPGQWSSDLPLVAGARTLIVRQGDDVVSLDLRGATPEETARLAGAGEDQWLAVAWVPPERMPAAVAAAESALVAQDSALVTSVTPPPVDSILMYLQVSRTQNADWATLLMKQLRADGYPASVLDPSEPEEGYRVLVGPFTSRESADSAGRAMGRPYFLLRLPGKKQ